MSATTATSATTARAAVVADLAARIADVAAVAVDLAGLTGPDVDVIATRAEAIADGLAAGEPAAIGRAHQLVDLDDVDDARSPLGIAIAARATDTVTQAFAAEVLGVSRPRVIALVDEHRLTGAVIAGRRYVTRASLAARLAGGNGR